MPLYEYRCNDCKSTFELLRASAEREVAAMCPSCESRASMPLISRVSAGPAPWPDSPAAPAQSPSSGGCCGGGCACN